MADLLFVVDLKHPIIVGWAKKILPTRHHSTTLRPMQRLIWIGNPSQHRTKLDKFKPLHIPYIAGVQEVENPAQYLPSLLLTP
jgi:hypothetical protein